MIIALKSFLTFIIFALVKTFNDIYVLVGNKIVGSQLEPSDVNYLIYKVYQRADVTFYIFAMVMLTLIWLNEIELLYKKIKEWFLSEGQ